MLTMSDVDVEVAASQSGADKPGLLNELEGLRSENARLLARMAKTSAAYQALKRDHAHMQQSLLEIELENEELRSVLALMSGHADRRAHIRKLLSNPASMNP